jgi:hypothetical protein
MAADAFREFKTGGGHGRDLSADVVVRGVLVQKQVLVREHAFEIVVGVFDLPGRQLPLLAYPTRPYQNEYVSASEPNHSVAQRGNDALVSIREQVSAIGYDPLRWKWPTDEVLALAGRIARLAQPDSQYHPEYCTCYTGGKGTRPHPGGEHGPHTYRGKNHSYRQRP